MLKGLQWCVTNVETDDDGDNRDRLYDFSEFY